MASAAATDGWWLGLTSDHQELVKRISRDCPETQLGMMRDVWICRNHESL